MPDMNDPDFRRRVNLLDTAFLQMIHRRGHAVQGVGGDPDKKKHPFCYTVGVAFNVGKDAGPVELPELFLPSLPLGTANVLLNLIADKSRELGAALPTGVPLVGFLNNDYPVVLRNMTPDEVEEQNVFVSRLRKPGWPAPAVQQVYWCDAGGSFPWEDGFPLHMLGDQPYIVEGKLAFKPDEPAVVYDVDSETEAKATA